MVIEELVSSRLKALKASLARKVAELERRFNDHFDDVKSANGQPLNDKRNGASTTRRWDRQSDAISKLKESIEKTKQAIDREQETIKNVASVKLPAPFRRALESGELSQWRKHPNTFFVTGVDKARILIEPENGKIVGIRYLSEVPKDQYQKLRDTFNRLRAEMAAEESTKP